MKKFSYSIALFINGVLALILGCIPMMYQAFTPINGFWRSYNPSYDGAVIDMNNAVDILKVLVAFGIALIIIAIIFKAVKINETKSVCLTLLLVPLAIIVLFSIINYLPLINFQIKYN